MRRVLIVAFALLLGLTADGFAAPKKTGSLTVNCPVIGATVMVDGVAVGTVPLSPQLIPFGKHSIRVVRKGLIDFTGDATIYPGQDTRFDAAPEKPMALFTVPASVKGEVLIDGELAGPLPLREFVVRPGKHAFLVRGPSIMPFKDSFMVSPNREFVAKPELKGKDGKPVPESLDLDLDMGGAVAAAPAMDLDLDMGPVAAAPAKPAPAAMDLDLDMGPVAVVTPPSKPGKTAPVAVAALDLDLDMEAPAAKPAAPAMDLDLDMDLPPTPAPTKPGKGTTVAAAPIKPPPVKPPPAPKALADKKPAPDLNVKKPVETQPGFVTDPIAIAEANPEDQVPGEPIYMNKLLWAGGAVAVVASIVVPLVWPKYIEERNPSAVCPECVASGTVLNMAR